jgi:Transglycosylase SLT domain
MRRLSLLALFLTCLAPLAQAQLMPLLAPPMAQPNGYRLCRPAIQAAEQRHNVPARLLAAIGRVESGRRDPETGETNPWPWAVNTEGQGFLFESKAKAISAVTEMQARGIRSIDVGCMQVNLMHHPDAFPSLAQAFDPAANADYAARFLVKLYGQTGAWPKAAAWYHSATPELGENYARQVMAVWPEEQKRPGPAPAPTALASAWGATISRSAHPFFGQSPPARIIALPGAAMPPPGTVGAAQAAGIAPSGSLAVGRGLDSYRAMPVIWAYRRPAPPPKASGG